MLTNFLNQCKLTIVWTNQIRIQNYEISKHIIKLVGISISSVMPFKKKSYMFSPQAFH